jgi:hypothetical protein
MPSTVVELSDAVPATGSGDGVYAVTDPLRGAMPPTDEGTSVATQIDPATTERTMLLAEIYRRNGSWRLRAIGQGYDDGLADLATRYGVETDG